MLLSNSPKLQRESDSNSQGYTLLKEQILVLIIHNNALARKGLVRVMEQEGYRVIEACNGQEGLEIFMHLQPEFILLDEAMPGLDDFTCSHPLRSIFQKASLPNLMLAEFPDLSVLDQSIEPLIQAPQGQMAQPIRWIVLKSRIDLLVQQSRSYQQMQQFYLELETCVQSYTAEIRAEAMQLVKALELESTLKRITDKVRDSLAEDQILQTVVQELAWTLGLGCCNAALYNPERQTSTVCCEYSAPIPGYQNRTIAMANRPEIYQHLRQGQVLHICSLTPNLDRGRVAMLAVPIRNDGETIGDLWLIHAEDRIWTDLEMRLVEQVANQCAIAIRQARLYQASQLQVQELERLNQLKDNFLSTVSHELRAPMANMRVAIEMMELLICTRAHPERSPHPRSSCLKVANYLSILKQECDREISLINDLLDLQRLESGQHRGDSTSIDIAAWLNELVTAFEIRVHERQQLLQTNFAANLGILQGDPVALHRIMTELLSNACKYSPPGATILLIASTGNQQLRLTVSNTGAEIPATEMGQIFKKFYRIPRGDRWQQGGTGLGLALVKQLLEQMQGQILVSSHAGVTSFTVVLPLVGGSSP